jgi:hypothetical protein
MGIKETSQIAIKKSVGFDESQVLHDLRHFLPAQAPLKDFIHHNTLHAFQDKKFHDALRSASVIFGYNTSLSLLEFRQAFQQGKILPEIIERVLSSLDKQEASKWRTLMMEGTFENLGLPRIGSVRGEWKKKMKFDLDAMVQPMLFRTICSYLDQGIAVWNFPVNHRGFLNALREMEETGFSSFFRGKRVRQILKTSRVEIKQLLDILVGDEKHYRAYLFDQQFSHPGWSGMVATVESLPGTLLDKRHITLHDLILFELLLEIDALDSHFPSGWHPLMKGNQEEVSDLFAAVEMMDYHRVIAYWQEAFEWSYYDQVLAGISSHPNTTRKPCEKTFQAIFCIDDRECSLRRYLEANDELCETFSTPGFFGVEFYFQPAGGKFLTKLCPAPVEPKYLIKEIGVEGNRKKDLHFSKATHNVMGGWLITQTIGFWSALKLFINIFRPSVSPAAASSFQHMNKLSKLTIETNHAEHKEKDLQVGFTVQEMADRVEAVLKSIGLIENFASIVYVAGHGSSSVNNPHYTAYDCGACSGRAGSVNARVFCFMANHIGVRSILKNHGIVIPQNTVFVGALHDTTRDEIEFFDEDALKDGLLVKHRIHQATFSKALTLNANERSRRFEYVNTHGDDLKVHEIVKRRSVSLFEPRPELNHATNAVCVVGRRSLTKHLFLDRRSFLNSYDSHIDPEGKYLFNILKAAAPVCGGINLEYFFSRVDNNKLGAGTKLPHNVMGLFGVANGIDGDLRPGLPSQMIEVHDPVRLLIIVEHFPEVVLSVIQKAPETYEWFINEWVRLCVIHPETNELYAFSEGKFTFYEPIQHVSQVDDLQGLIRSNHNNIPVKQINK